jgi:hypothetical protein
MAWRINGKNDVYVRSRHASFRLNSYYVFRMHGFFLTHLFSLDGRGELDFGLVGESSEESQYNRIAKEGLVS